MGNSAAGSPARGPAGSLARGPAVAMGTNVEWKPELMPAAVMSTVVEKPGIRTWLPH